MAITFTPPDGVAINFDDGVTHRFLSLSGRGAPPVTPRDTPVIAGGGTTLHAADVPPREVELRFTVAGATFAALDDHLAELQADLTGANGSGIPREGVLELITYSGVTRRLRCLAVAGLERTGSSRGHTRDTRVRFYAPHPWWYGGSEQVATITIGQPGSLRYPHGYPHGYGLDGPSGAAVITYAGTAWSQSLLWQVPGPARAPMILNAQTGRSVSFAPEFLVPPGLTLHVRMGWRPDGDGRADLRAWLEGASGARTSVLGSLTSAVRPVALAPGMNRIIVSQANAATPAPVHTVRYWAEYVGA